MNTKVMDWTNPDWQNPDSPLYAHPTNHRLIPGAWEYGTRYAYVRDHITRGSKVLDVGCNCGQLAKNLLQDLDCVMWGVDIVPAFIEHCQTMREAPDLGPFAVGDFSRMTLDDLGDAGLLGEAFPYVTALEVIEHPISLYGFRENLRQVLAVGGTFILTTPHPDNPDTWAMLRDTAWHVGVWTKSLLETWLGPLVDCTTLMTEDGRPGHLAAMWQWDGQGHVDDLLFKRLEELNVAKAGLTGRTI